MLLMSDIQAVFAEDVKDKKRTGAGIFKRTGKKGYVGKMTTPYDLMSSKEKKQLNNQVVSYSMYDTIMPYDEFKMLSEQARAKTIGEYLKRFPRKKIAEVWGVQAYTVHDWVSKLGLSQSRRLKQIKPQQKEDEEPVEKNEGFSIKLIGSFNGKEIQDRLVALAQILVEERPYSISFVVNEEAKR